MDYPQQQIKPYNREEQKTKQVERMFDNIAPAYDRLNHTMSFGIDRYWRRKAIDKLRPHSPQCLMDVATGTGDFAIMACHTLQPAELIGTDISEGMMAVGRDKVAKEGLADKITFAREDCTALSFDDNRFDAITVAFGIRNFDNLDKGLAEMCRVLRPGGHLVILELTTPDKFPMKQLFGIYSRVVIPVLGKLLSKDNSAYRYLPDTIKAFPQGEVMQGVIQRAGFGSVGFQRLTLGICTLYMATK
jgi:demethylmenaquinone methyltransferase/2-methoxy-6-polyprenyl-1,4-benzoquinol methylase